MPFNWGLLSEQSLANQPQEIRQGLQEQATKQFLINTLLGGGLGAGYAAAQAVPEQYQTRVEQQQFERNLAQARQRAMEPVMAEAAGPVMPGEQPPQMAVGQRFNPEAFLQQLPAVVAQAGPRAKVGNVKEFAELFPKTVNQYKDGLIVSPGGTPLAFAPKLDTERGVQVIAGQASAIPGFREARIASRVPETAQNTEPYITPTGQVGVRPLIGASQTVEALKGAEVRAQEGEKIVPVTMPDNSIRYLRQSDLVQRLGTGTQATANQPPAMPGAPQPGGFRTQSAYDVARQKTFEKAITKAQTDADMASSQNRTLDQLQVGIDNFPTGAFAQQKAALTSALSAIGVTGKRADQMLTGFSQTVTGLADFTANSIQDLSGATSDKDIVFSRQRFGQITDTKSALQFQIDMQRAINRRRIQKYEYLSENAGPDAERGWRKSSGASSIFEEPELRKYLPTRQTRDGATAHKLPTGEWVVFD